MAKYLISGSYTTDGLKGLQKDKASGRRQAVSAAGSNAPISRSARMTSI